MFLPPAEFVRAPAALAERYDLAQAQAYTRWLATHHYENFQVVSWLLPRNLHQDFYNVYAFCRWADDLGDEMGDPAESLRLLAWWQGELDAMYHGKATNPVFVALMDTVFRHRIPPQPFADLIHAFVQDQTVTRYQDWPELFQYCSYSANPVGRLVLYLCGYSDPRRQNLSDATCMGLQLANFWQDVSVDLGKDRVYIPLSVMEKHGYTVEQLFARQMSPAFAAVMREVSEKALFLFVKGLPLPRLVQPRLALDIELFSRGGMRILKKIEQQNYDVLSRRPAISKTERGWMLLTTLVRMAFARAA